MPQNFFIAILRATASDEHDSRKWSIPCGNRERSREMDRPVGVRDFLLCIRLRIDGLLHPRDRRPGRCMTAIQFERQTQRALRELPENGGADNAAIKSWIAGKHPRW